ncbi:MAG: zf-HC2 domain-containing protein [Pyrinomonadaceae bacterium]
MSGKTDPEATRHGCERGEDLVAYLYGETPKQEAALFRQHLDACAVCREELAAFGGVRAGLSAWRADALGTVPSLNILDAFAPATEPRPTARRRSARAALREFFSLSPLWLRASAFAATLAVCALVALTLARAEIRWGSDGLAFRTGVTEKIVTEQIQAPTQGGYTEEQVNAIVARKVAEATAQLTVKAKEETGGPRPDTVINVSGGGKNQQQPAATTSPRRKRPARADARRNEPLLAEDELPRLSDLLRSSY